MQNLQLNTFYEELISPNNLIKSFKNEDDFIKWLDQGTLKDIQYTLKAFEKDELYEWCDTILKFINSKNEKIRNL